MTVNIDPKRVRCRREGYTWNPLVFTKRVPHRVGDHVVYEDHLFINCPTCLRAYQYEAEHDRWMSDRPLHLITP